MKGLLLIVAVMLTGLSGCYVVPYGTRDDGYRRDRDHREDSERQRGRDGHGGERGNRDRYH